MSSNTSSGEERIVSVTEKGQATIPKQLREKHGIPAPGRVKFVENEDGEIVVRPVGSMREFRGLERDSDEDRPATATLREERERDTQRTDDVVDRFASDTGDE
ncbi:AbrB/MazE/SpoVT family DNA-binding domain-containing protein [Natrarchaeobius chitinivorans]|uniref:AbrB/MazE/SpoVT family DNA-binding domain-containing protein n=1 Tax=Natrarchaeobius chitinivorans TaxID=1679083 RepID=A0A3N6M836_NATCH|nr:AbrB/MazE/SpoVT family DNA-binding domain-containing protein [Natrarchaeobius chitinivorans]RQG92350.1 AbrB/MazE/SpoVT family DNA-binding domain-containing protein [Natrarchaeobius chitinivorans]